MNNITVLELLELTGYTAQELLDKLEVAMASYCIESGFAPAVTELVLAAQRAPALDEDPRMVH